MSKLRQSARGRQCMIRVPGICNHNDETTVLAHLPNQSMGMKAPDIHGAFACSDCHDAVDRRTHTGLPADLLRLYHLMGVIRTQEIWLKEGLIKIGGGK